MNLVLSSNNFIFVPQHCAKVEVRICSLVDVTRVSWPGGAGFRGGLCSCCLLLFSGADSIFK